MQSFPGVKATIWVCVFAAVGFSSVASAKKICRKVVNVGETNWNKTNVKKALEVLYQNGISPNSKFLDRSYDKKATEIVSDAIGFQTSLQRVYWYAIKFYGDLPTALKAARLPVGLIVQNGPKRNPWTPELVQKGLQVLIEMGISPTARELKRPRSEEIENKLSSVLGFRTRPRLVWEKSYEHFGSLLHALWPKENVLRALKVLYSKGYLPNQKLFKYTTDPVELRKLSKILKEEFGYEISLGTIFSQLKRHFGSIQKALEAANLPADKIIRPPPPSQPWTPEMVRLSLQALYNAGIKPKYNNLILEKDEKIKARALEIVVGITGFETSLATLINRAKEFHNNDYEAALKDADLPLEEVLKVKVRTEWNNENVLQALRILYESGFVPTASSLQRGSSKKATELLTRELGFEAIPSTLYLKAVEFYKDYQAAVFLSGLPVQKIVGKYSTKNMTKKATHRGLIALYENGYVPTPVFLRDEKRQDVEDIVSEAVGFPCTLSALYRFAREFHGGVYQNAVAEAGLPVYKIIRRLQAGELTTEKMYEGLRALYRHGYIPNTRLLTGKNDSAAEVLSEAVGFPTTLKTLHDHLRKSHKTFREAIVAADLPAEKIIGHGKSWSREFIVQALEAIDSNGYTPYEAYLRRSQNPDAERLLSDLTGYPMRLSALLVQAEKAFGSFAAAIKATKLDPSQVLRSKRTDLTTFEVQTALGALFENGILPNSAALTKGGAEMYRIISNTLKKPVSASILYVFAMKGFNGSLRAALLAARLPVDEILLRIEPGIDRMAQVSTQTERYVEDGQLRYVNYIGIPSLTPEELLLKSEVQKVALRKIPAKDRSMASEVLDVIFSYEEGSLTAEDLSQIISRDNKIQITPDDVMGFLKLFSENEEFRQYLLGR